MGIFGSIAALIVTLLASPMIVSWWESGITATQQRLAASHMSMVVQAAKQYVDHNQSTLLPTTSESSGPVVSIQDLKDGDFLPDGFRELNPWLQGYEIHVRQPKSGTLQAIVLTQGGPDMPTKFSTVTVPGAAVLIGGAGGFVPPDGIYPGIGEDTLQGAGNGWVLDLASVGIASPGQGHLGAISSYDSSALGQDFLYRISIPGQPDLNTMETDLDMTDHALKHVREVHFTPHEIDSDTCTTAEEDGRVFLDSLQGLYICRNGSLEIVGDTGNSQMMKKVSIETDGTKVAKPACAPGSGTAPAIFTSPALVESGSTAYPMNAVQTWATNASESEWQVNMRVLTNDKSGSPNKDGWVRPAPEHGKIVVMTMCVKEDAAATP